MPCRRDAEHQRTALLIEQAEQDWLAWCAFVFTDNTKKLDRAEARKAICKWADEAERRGWEAFADAATAACTARRDEAEKEALVEAKSRGWTQYKRLKLNIEPQSMSYIEGFEEAVEEIAILRARGPADAG